MRQDTDFPQCITVWGWRYHHVGVPTTKPREGERYLPQFRLFTSGFATSPVGVEWMRYAPGCEIPELVQTVPHVAFVVDDLDYELANRGFIVVTPPNPPSQGVRVAMVEIDGAPIELMEFAKPN